MLHPHAQLIQLIPGLRQRQRTVLRVLVVQNEALLEPRAQVLDPLELLLDTPDLVGLLLGRVQLRLQTTADRADLHHFIPGVGEPLVELGGQAGELLPQHVILFLAGPLMLQIGLAILDGLCLINLH